MTLHVTHSRIDGYRPGNEAEPHARFEGHEIEEVEITRRLRSEHDHARIRITNNDGTRAGTVRSGDKLRVFVVRPNAVV